MGGRGEVDLYDAIASKSLCLFVVFLCFFFVFLRFCDFQRLCFPHFCFRFSPLFARFLLIFFLFSHLFFLDCAISSNHVVFGEVHFLTPAMRTITLENVGQVNAQFRFIPKNNDDSFCRPWLLISPSAGFLVPGEKVEISFTMQVDRTTVTKLNLGEERIEDILILHLENGKDMFVTVSGEYNVTCFGMPLELLFRLPKPVRQMSWVRRNYVEMECC